MKAFIFLADGFEDIEALGVRDVLMRGGVETLLVSITSDRLVRSSRGLTVFADTIMASLGDVCQDDILIFPGGMPGSRNLGECGPLMILMDSHYRRGGWLAAICAAPKWVLGNLSGIDWQSFEFTCYDGCQSDLEVRGATFRARPYVVSQRIVTGRGPGHALDFGLMILQQMRGIETAGSVSEGLTLPCE